MTDASTQQRSRIACLSALVLLVATPAAMGNPAAAGFMIVVGHIIVGNFLIGVGEGVFAKALGARWWAFAILIVANYVSGWVGVMVAGSLFAWLFEVIDPEPLRAALPASLLAILMLALLGFVIEAPFYALCFRRPRKNWRRVLAALIVANVLSNAALAAYYVNHSDSTLATTMKVVESPEEVVAMITGPVPDVYYSAGKVYRRSLDGTSEPEPVAVQGYPAMGGMARPDGGIDLVWSDRWRDEEPKTVVEDIGEAASVWPGSPLGAPAADLRPVDARDAEVEFGGVGVGGITIRDEEGERRLNLFNAFIGARLVPRAVSVLPDQILVFELYDLVNERSHGIYVASLEANRIARLGDGSCPVVVYDQPIEGWAPPDPAD